MDIWSWLKEVAILIVVYEITATASDFLESFRPKEDNPPELNEFLTNVLDHKSDFSYIRAAARKFQKMKKDIQSGLDPLEQPLDYYDVFLIEAVKGVSAFEISDFFNNYKSDSKRHAHSYYNYKKNRGFNQRMSRIPMKKINRFRRGVKRFFPHQIFAEIEVENNIQKRGPEESGQKERIGESLPSQIFVEPAGEHLEKRMIPNVDIESDGSTGEIDVEGEDGWRSRKQAIDFEDAAVHRTYKHKKDRERARQHNQGDFYYVDLEEEAKKNQERRFDPFPQRQEFGNRDKMVYRPNPERHDNFDPNPERHDNFRPNPERHEHYDESVNQEEPLHHSLNDEVAFEKALSYEMEPSHQDRFNNNPKGNNLYSVDEGRADNIQLISPDHREFKIGDTQQSVTSGNVLTDESSVSIGGINNPAGTVTFNNLEADKNKKTTFIPVGHGFIEISKSRRDDSEKLQNLNEKSPFLLNSLVKVNENYDNQKIAGDVNNGKEPISEIIESPKLLKAEQSSIVKDSSRSVDAEDLKNAQNEKLSLRGNEEANDHLLQENIKAPNDMIDRDYKQSFIGENLDNEEHEKVSLNLKDLASENLDQQPVGDNPRSLERSDISKKATEFIAEDSPLVNDEQNDKLFVKNNGDSRKEASNENERESSILSKNALHPLRVREENEEEPFQSRKLQFIDDENTQVEEQENDYKELPPRPRRDFLDALGMKNEEDYAEDNALKDITTDNNTDINNDTTYKNFTTRKCSFTKSTTCSPKKQKEEVKHIKEILEEPKEVSAENTIGTFKKQKDKKRRSKPKRQSDFDDSDGITEDREIRVERDAFDKDTDDVAAKILQNKNKIYNQREDVRDRSYNSNHVQIKRTMPKWPEASLSNNNLKKPVSNFVHKIEKKEDTDLITTSFPLLRNCTDMDVVNSTYEETALQLDAENEKLAQVANGQLAKKIVSSVFDQVKTRNELRAKFYSGLSRKHVDFTGTMDFNIFSSNASEDADEAKLLLDQITKVLNKLVLNQIRRKLCQRLPDELKDYMDNMLNVKNVVETTNFEPNTNQGSFLFTYQEKTEPPFNVKKLQDTLLELEKLLMSYRSMSEDCQNRAEPVKDYIEKHVKILKEIVSCPDHNCAGAMKRDTPNIYNRLVEKELESVGLGKKHQFIPNFDLNKLVKSKMKYAKRDQKRDITTHGDSKSEKYRKLKIAADKIREKRENEKKIAELFGGKKKRTPKAFDVDYEEPVVYSLG